MPSWEIASSGDALPIIELARKADTKAIRIGNDEISETVITVGNWKNDPCPDFTHPLPVVVHIGNHYSNVSARKLWNG